MSSSTSAIKATVIYDGECQFCIKRVKELQNLDKRRLFEYMARQDSRAEAEFPQIVGIKLDDGILPERLCSGRCHLSDLPRFTRIENGRVALLSARHSPINPTGIQPGGGE
jgi:hypothetical protein